jgi:hypothetical protein
MTDDLLLWQKTTRPLVREGAPQSKAVTVKQQSISGREPQMGLHIKTDWLTDWPTDRQSQCDFDFEASE